MASQSLPQVLPPEQPQQLTLFSTAHFIVTPLGLISRPGAPLDEWMDVGARVFAMGNGASWAIGDWYLYPERRNEYGEKYAEAILETRRSYSTLRNCVSIAKAFELSRRRDNLGWAHHAAVAALDEPQQEFFLDLAIEHRWTLQELREAIRAWKLQRQLKAENQPDVVPVIQQADASAFLSSLSEGYADLLLTDPPYSSDIEDIEDFAAAWVPLALSRVKPTGRAYIFTGAYPRELRAYLNVLATVPPGWTLDNVLVWEYRNTLGPSPTHGYFLNWQACFYLYGPDAPPIDCPLLVEQTAVHEVNAPQGSHRLRLHPWEKPAELVERFIRHATRPGETVIDCFAGTGTTLLAAAKLGRYAIGADNDADQVALCEQRGCQRG